MHLQDYYAQRIYDFVKAHGQYIFDAIKNKGLNPSVTLKSAIKKHMEYNTLIAVWDRGDIVGVCTFNISPDGKICFMTNCIVHPKYRFMNVLRKMTQIGYDRYPTVDKLHFHREFKEKKAKLHKINVRRFLQLQTQEMN